MTTRVEWTLGVGDKRLVLEQLATWTGVDRNALDLAESYQSTSNWVEMHHTRSTQPGQITSDCIEFSS